MDNQFSTLFYLIPVAVLIWLRSFIAKKRTAEARERRARQAALEQPNAPGVRAEAPNAFSPPASGAAPAEWQPHWIEEEENTAETAPPPTMDRYAIHEETPAVASMAVENPLASFPAADSPLSSIPDSAKPRSFPLSGDGPALLSGADLSRAATAAAAAARADRPFPKTVERLPPWKKALALSEILGKPKALRETDREL